MTAWLDYREAGRRVGRDERTIRRWRRHGMVMGWGTRDGQQARVVREDVLLAWWRQTMMNDPVHQNRLRGLSRMPATDHQGR